MDNLVQIINKITEDIQSEIDFQPRIGLILGTGLGNLADSVTSSAVIPYDQLRDWPRTTVEGHAGRLVCGYLEQQPSVVMQGRIHYYEGYTIQQVTLPVRIMQKLGIEILIVTNAAGAINPDFSPGEVMLITDNLNLIGMAGLNPLVGPNLDEFGPRFTDMSRSYDHDLCEIARRIATEHDIPLREGVYAGLSGPSFESPADLRFLHIAGADVVGMSTTSEVIVARHGGTRVLGFSGISNKANLDGTTITSHEEVLQAGSVIVPQLQKLITGILRAI